MQSVLQAGKSLRIAVCGHLLVQRLKGTDKTGEQHLYQQSGITYVYGTEIRIDQLREKEKAMREVGGLSSSDWRGCRKAESTQPQYCCMPAQARKTTDN